MSLKGVTADGRPQLAYSQTVYAWRGLVVDATRRALADRPALAGALSGEVTFALPRPRGHYRTGRHHDELRPGAPAWPTSRPDLDKLLRAICDALTAAGAWADDAQLVTLATTKVYAADPTRVGARITLRQLTTCTVSDN
jgi:crossover junction endodeoxyribonuclease RusA